MKKKPIVVLALASFLLSAFAAAQITPKPPRPAGSGGGRSAPEQQQPAMPNELEKNISISISGTMGAGMPVELTMTGCGRVFRSEALLGTSDIGGNKIPTVGAIQYLVKPTGNGYIISYSIGARIAIPTSSSTAKTGGAKTTSIGFEEILVDGTVRCKPGEAIEIFKSGDDAVTLKLVEHDS